MSDLSLDRSGSGSLRQGAKALLALQRNRIRTYRPYSKQLLFHSLGKTHRERCLLAANQSGKSISAAAECYFHLSGNYPDWWTGRRYDRPVSIWISNQSFEQVRDNGQRLLMGEGGQEVFGQGLIPKREIADWTMSRSTSDCVDTVWVNHVSGGRSYFKTKAYEQGRLKWQGWTGDIIWLDEECPLDIYSEAQTRLAVRQGMIMLTATPLMGQTEVVEMFYPVPNAKVRAIVGMTLDDADHFTDTERAEVIESWPEHEREARGRGEPMMGEGLIFPVAEEVFLIEPIPIPDYWLRIAGLDFGYDHPTAAAELAINPDLDVIYVTRDYARSGAQVTVGDHAVALRPWGDNWMKWAWPHDGNRLEDKESDTTTADAYRKAGLRLLPQHATFPDGSVGVDAGLNQMLERMRTGRFKVFNTCLLWKKERRGYHRTRDRNGMSRIVKKRDDVISASRYAFMMRRAASSPEWERRSFKADTAGIDYDPIQPRVGYAGVDPGPDPLGRR